MADMPFDSMTVLRRLESKGFTSEQAEAITASIKDGVTGGVATKADLARLEAELKTELKWIKLIGGAILAVLVLPWLAELIAATMP
ncbi:MAG: DUF1640 domain-containing protein [Boseongicola sp. SB0673_bin_14]|nr:DUF1640 domain-containing protein [Boseongicola sp. SB0667_bin_21]MYI68888.1 DUF1640 domain-containing protein [Boseongicola sp. SB0673_bin_14]